MQRRLEKNEATKKDEKPPGKKLMSYVKLLEECFK